MSENPGTEYTLENYNTAPTGHAWWGDVDTGSYADIMYKLNRSCLCGGYEYRILWKDNKPVLNRKHHRYLQSISSMCLAENMH